MQSKKHMFKVNNEINKQDLFKVTVTRTKPRYYPSTFISNNLYWTLLYCILHYCTLHCINIANYNLLQCIYVCHYLDLFPSDNQGLHYFSRVTKILPSGVFPITGFRYFSNHQMDNRFKLITRLKSYYAYAIIMDNLINYLPVQR